MIPETNKKIVRRTRQIVRGRAHPLALGLILLVTALLLHKSWWWVGLVVVLVVFVEAWFRYTRLD